MSNGVLSLGVMAALISMNAGGVPAVAASVSPSSDTVWVARVAPRLAAPPVCTSTLAWVATKGSVRAHSMEDGSRRFHQRVSGNILLHAAGGDSVLALRQYPRGSFTVFESNPPRRTFQYSLSRSVLAVDCGGSLVAALLRRGAAGILREGRWIPKAFPRASAPGWSNVQVAYAGGDTVLVLSKRDGQAVAIRGDSLVPLGMAFRGSVVEAASVGDSLLLIGGEGTLALVDSGLSVVWKSTLSAGVQFNPLIHNGMMWSALRNRRLVLVDIRRGEPIGDWPLSGPLSCPMALWGEGVAWATFSGEVSAISGVGSTPAKVAHSARAAVGIASAGSRLVIAGEDGTLLCIQARQ